jgi:hypothetical protein
MGSWGFKSPAVMVIVILPTGEQIPFALPLFAHYLKNSKQD